MVVSEAGSVVLIDYSGIHFLNQHHLAVHQEIVPALPGQDSHQSIIHSFLEES